MSGKHPILVEQMPSMAVDVRHAAMHKTAPATYIAVVLGVLVLAALVHVWVHLQVIQAGYDLSRETRRHHDLVEQNGKLRLELAVRKDPSVVERRARTELGMAPPEPTQIRILSDVKR